MFSFTLEDLGITLIMTCLFLFMLALALP